MKKVGLVFDYVGFELKEFVKIWLIEKGYLCKDFGIYSIESCDYVDYVYLFVLVIEVGECGFGVVICGSGEGISMILNKYQGICVVLCWMFEIVYLLCQYNDVNVLVMLG